MGVMRVGVWLVALGLGSGAAWGQSLVGKGNRSTSQVNRGEAAIDMGHPSFHPELGQASGKDVIMSPAQAKELLASVDEVMGFAAKDTGLAGVPHVKRQLVTRAEVTKYLIQSFDEDESSKRLQRSEIVLKKFGLLNRDFNLRPFLLSLLTEQIAGYYDDKTKTVNLLNWIEPRQQRPVLAHELTHAIQDQKVDLEKWSNDGFKGVSHTASEDAGRVAGDEKETARQAVAEGQAMVVFVDYATDHPTAGKDEDGGGGSDVMSRAPLLLQRSLEFPYISGLAFEKAMLEAGGKKTAFAGVLDTPPNSSFEILHPAQYLKHAVVPSLRLGDVHSLLDAEYEPYDVGVMGELDVEIMANLFGGVQVAEAVSPAWDGGVYYAAQRRSATAAEKQTTGSLGVLYYSRWKSAAAARAFAQVYGAELGRKYSGLSERKGDEGEGEKVFSTSEGDVLMWMSEDDLFISEGFPLATARKLETQVVGAQGTGPMRMAVGPELGLGVAGRLAGFGVMKAGWEVGELTHRGEAAMNGAPGCDEWGTRLGVAILRSWRVSWTRLRLELSGGAGCTRCRG